MFRCRHWIRGTPRPRPRQPKSVDVDATAAAAGSWPHNQPDLLERLQPDGLKEEPHDARYERDQDGGWIWGNHPAYTDDEQQELRETVKSLKHTFAYSLRDMPGYSGPLGPVELKLTHNRPLVTPARRYSPLEEEIRDEKCIEQEEAGIIEEISTDNRYASAPTMPAKKDADGNWTDRRFCVDFRRINDGMEHDWYTVPLPEEMFQKMRGARVFSCLDARAGFHQLPLTDQSKPLTAFWWGRRLFCYNRLPFGIKTATSEFQKRVDHALTTAGLDHCAGAFVDDVIIWGADTQQHTRDVALQRWNAAEVMADGR